MLVYKTKSNKYRLEFNKSLFNTGYVLEFFINKELRHVTNLDKKDVLNMLEFIEKKER